MSRKFYPGFTIFTFLFFHLPLLSQTFSLLKDINAGAGGSSFFNFTSVNGTLYFRPDDGVHGDELWKTNGTEAGTVLVKDINPGIALIKAVPAAVPSLFHSSLPDAPP